MKKRIALLLAAVMILGCLSGCGSSSKEAYASSAPRDSGKPQMEAAEEASDWKSDNLAMEPAAPMEEEAISGGGAGSVTVPNPAEKIIYTADVSLETREFDKAVGALEAMVSELGGYIESSNVSGNTYYNDDGTTRIMNRYAYYTVAVPAQSFEQALNIAGEIGNVTNKSRNAQNITSQYSDTEARLESLDVQEERILSMMKEAEDIESLIALEARLSDISYEKDSYARQLKNYDRQVAYSTLYFTVREVEVFTPTAGVTRTFGEKVSDAIRDGWQNFTRALENFFLWFLEALPTILLWAVIIFVVLLFVRKGKARRQARRAKRAEEKAERKAEKAAAKAAPKEE